MKPAAIAAIGGLSLCLIAPLSAHAFCVYNKTGVQVWVRQPAVRGFNKYIATGGKECCNWKEKSCNSNGKQTALLSMSGTVNTWPYGGSGTGFVDCGVRTDYGVTDSHEIKLEAGGWLVFERNGSYKKPSYVTPKNNTDYIHLKVLEDRTVESRVYKVSSYLHDGRPYAVYYCPGFTRK